MLGLNFTATICFYSNKFLRKWNPSHRKMRAFKKLADKREMYLATARKVHTCSQKDEENKNHSKRYSWQQNTRNRPTVFMCTAGYLIYFLFIYIFFPRLGHRKVIWSRCLMLFVDLYSNMTMATRISSKRSDVSAGGIWDRYGRGNPSHRSDAGGWEACWLRCKFERFVSGVFLWRWNFETTSGDILCGSYFAKLVRQMLCFPRLWRRCWKLWEMLWGSLCSACAVLRSFFHFDWVHHATAAWRYLSPTFEGRDPPIVSLPCWWWWWPKGVPPSPAPRCRGSCLASGFWKCCEDIGDETTGVAFHVSCKCSRFHSRREVSKTTAL